MVRIFKDLEHQLDMLSCIISDLSEIDYNSKGNHISSIGAHVRHMIEYVQILTNSDLLLPINYANRKRNLKLENNKHYAVTEINELKKSLKKPDQNVYVLEDSETYSSSYLREMLYMHEHIIHHCAILKIELESLNYININPSFGFAKSTIKRISINVPT